MREILSFSFQEMYLSRILIRDKNHLIKYIKFLSKRHSIPADKIVFNHDLDDSFNTNFINNFKVNNSFDWIKEELKK